MGGEKQPRQHHSGFSLSSVPQKPPGRGEQCCGFAQDVDGYSRPTPEQCGSTPWSSSSWEVGYTSCIQRLPRGREGAVQVVWGGPALGEDKVVYELGAYSAHLCVPEQTRPPETSPGSELFQPAELCQRPARVWRGGLQM